jgi:hypothetical protein
MMNYKIDDINQRNTFKEVFGLNNYIPVFQAFFWAHPTKPKRYSTKREQQRLAAYFNGQRKPNDELLEDINEVLNWLQR